MGVDLFFVDKELDLEAAQAPGFKASTAQSRRRAKLLRAIAERFEGAAIRDGALVGPVAGFAWGELIVHPGHLHWAIHGVPEDSLVPDVVDWFLAQGMVCEDPQNLGFSNRAGKVGKETLSDWSALVGAGLVSIELSSPGVTGVLLVWRLADGREARLRCIHHERCEVPPNLTALIRDTVVRVDFEPGRLADDFRFVFSGGAEIRCIGAVPTQYFAQPAPRSGW